MHLLHTGEIMSPLYIKKTKVLNAKTNSTCNHLDSFVSEHLAHESFDGKWSHFDWNVGFTVNNFSSW